MKAASKTLVLFITIQFLFAPLAWPTSAVKPIRPAKEVRLPPISLLVPKAPGEKRYLGLSRDGYFRIPQIKAKVVIITLLSLYCPTCQETALEMTDLFYRIEDRPDLKGKMKLIGIGAGNTRVEAETFKETYRVPFPVFPDEDFRIHKAFGDVRTPFFIAVRIDGRNGHQIVHTHLGRITEADRFINQILHIFEPKEGDLPPKTEELMVSAPQEAHK